MRIPVWFHLKSDYYDILLDAMMRSTRLGCVQLNRKGFRYVKVPIGTSVMVEMVDDISKEVFIGGEGGEQERVPVL